MPRFLTICLVAGPLCCSSCTKQTASTGPIQRHAEALAGARAAAELESSCGGIFNCPRAQERVDRVGLAVAAHCGFQAEQEWQFKILASPQPNAYSLPLNRVYLTRGLYERIGEDDALLAAAIAHEMAHIDHRDSFKPECQSEEATLTRESAADDGALNYLRKSEYSSESLSRLLLLIADVQPAGWAETRVQHIASR